MTTNGIATVYASTPTQPSVPIVDLSPFTVPPTLLAPISARKATASRIRATLSTNGYIGITGHGISQSLLDQAFELSKAFFDLPYETKMLAPHPDANIPHGGYSGIGQERGGKMTEVNEDIGEGPVVVKDFKETYEIGSPNNKSQYNIWLPQDVLPDFQPFMLTFQDNLNRLVAHIFEALIMSLELCEEEADNVRVLNTDLENQLRLAHYPPVPEEILADESVSRLGEHRDWSTFTLPFQKDQSGLEFHDQMTDSFIPATPKEGVVYLNVGDAFHRVSNGVYPSALLRVVMPGRDSKATSVSRYSIPFFVSPPPDGILSPQPSLVKMRGKQVFEPITFHEYSMKMFEATNVFA